jgi:hypothetical protein
VAPPSSSSTKKAARLTQRGKGRKVRFQGGTLFPFVVALILVLGLGTIVYARQSQPAFDATPPTTDDHWHVAYGFYLCGEWYQLQGNLEASGSEDLARYTRTGVHSHDDGVIHWHAFSSAAVGSRAKLGLFLDNYGVDLGNEELKFPDGQPAIGSAGGTAEAEYAEDETQCDGEDAELQVVAWDSPAETGDGTTYIANFDEIPISKNSLVFSIAFAPRDDAIPMPPWAAQLEELGSVDEGQTAPGGTTPDGSVVPAGSTVPGTAAPGDARTTELPTTTSPPSPPTG